MTVQRIISSLLRHGADELHLSVREVTFPLLFREQKAVLPPPKGLEQYASDECPQSDEHPEPCTGALHC